MTAAAGPGRRQNAWATTSSAFGASVMVVVGVLQLLQGLVAVVSGDDFVVATPNFVFELDVTTWGWVHLVVGAVVTLVGLFIFTGNVAARAVGVLLVSLAAIANFLWIPYYPLWAILLVALNVLVIWGLTTSNLREL